MLILKKYTFQESNKKNFESLNINKKGFSLVLLLDINLKDTENNLIISMIVLKKYQKIIYYQMI